jgi:HEAT repeat protein
VEALRQALAIQIVAPSRMKEEVEARRKAVADRAAALHGVVEIRRALQLWEWRDDDQDLVVALADRKTRAELLSRFEQLLHEGLRSTDPRNQLGAATLIAEVGLVIEGKAEGTGMGRALVPDLLAILKQPGPAPVHAAAARALGSAFPDPQTAVPALAHLLESSEPLERRAAAAGLGHLVRVASSLFRDLHWPSFIRAKRIDVVAAGRAAIPVAVGRLDDPDAEVRRLCTEVIHQGALALAGVIPDPERIGSQFRGSNGTEDALAATKFLESTDPEIRPLALALAAQALQLSRRLADNDPGVCVAANQAFEAIAEARHGLRTVKPRLGPKEKPLVDLMTEALRPCLPALAQDLTHADVRVRLGAIYVLETLEKEAAPVAGELAAALKDTDPFVRWGAARALGKMAPEAANKAVPGLAGVAEDPSGDVRATALFALQRYGPAAKAAVPALTQALQRGDPETRELAARALGAIGPEAGPAAPALAAALTASRPELRKAAAEALGRLGAVPQTAEDALVKTLNDPDEAVRLAAADALVQIQQAKPRPNP